MGKSIKGTETEKNLLKSFAGESQARGRYTMYAKVAKNEGYMQIAAIFEETAYNEYQHAKQFFNFLEGGMVEFTAAYPTDIGTTEENLKFAAMGEHEEHTKLYPGFAKIADEEGFPDIALKWRNVSKVEVEHEKRYLALLDVVKNSTVFKKSKKVKWKCEVCGFIHEGEEPPKICPVCGHDYHHSELLCAEY